MWTGKQTLSTLNQALHTARNEMDVLDTELNYYTTRLAEARREQTAAYQRFARIRLEDITQDDSDRDLQDSLASADSLALESLQQRAKAYIGLETTIQTGRDDLDQLEQQREHAAGQLEMEAEKLIKLEAQAQASLEADDDYQARFQIARQADLTAQRAEEKTKIAATDRIEKGKPYEEDELFSYLWQRRYGTPQYQANPLTRFLDAWVARLCNYDSARLNYWTLLEIPKRMQGHAESVRDNAEQERQALEAIEARFAAEAGVKAQQQRSLQQQQILDDLDRQMDRKEIKLQDLLNRRAAYSAGEDQYFKQAVDILARVAQRKDIAELQHLARATLHRQDDDLVTEIAGLRNEERDLQEQIREHRRHQDARLKRVRDLEQVRSQFKHSRYDDVRSGFNNENLISMALSEFMKGLLNSNELWNTLSRHQRHRDVGAWPDFGSGGLGGNGTKGRHSPWHWPGGSRPGDRFRLPGRGSSRNRGGGGFRTGGGF